MKNSIFLLMICVVYFATSCAPKQYAATEKIYRSKAKLFGKQLASTPPQGQLIDSVFTHGSSWVGSINFGMRRPNYVVIHHTAQDSLAQTIRTFHNARASVSSHYVIGRDGQVVQMVNDLFRAHHAGISKWGNDTDLNSSSIGIELDNNGTTDLWPPEQIDALLRLLGVLKERYRIPQANFLGHMDVSPTRKIDPANFPWKILAGQGYGFWYDEMLTLALEDFDHLLALRLIGYDISDPTAAIRAFKRHYVQFDTSATVTEYDRSVIYQIFLQYR